LILSRYKSGPLPKPFKLLPTLPIPQQAPLITLTRPDLWTANATYEATRLFISRAPNVAQAFCSEILLHATRDNIRETKKLNVHLYKALKKALYKPAAFFKGLVFPLLLEGCTLREAQIISSVVVRVSIPVLHSAAALQRICEIAAEQMTGREGVNGASAANLFIKVLLEKKYALPYKVVDAVVFHFLRFRVVNAGAEPDHAATIHRNEKEEDLPVIWHQSLLAFAQRYRNDITEDQRESLLDVVNSRGHRLIGPEIRRELLAGRGRGVLLEDRSDVAMGGDDTMVGINFSAPQGVMAG
jgi:essential nuclear protein 1